MICFIVNNRTKPTLRNIIDNIIGPNCPLIFSNSFHPYKTIREETGWNHHIVNHQRNLVNPIKISVMGSDATVYREVKVHTPYVERYNRELKKYIKRFYGMQKEQKVDTVREAAFFV